MELIKFCWQFNSALAQGKSSGVCGYDYHFIMADGEPMSFEAALDNAGLIRNAIIENMSDQWQIVGRDINYEDQDMVCVQTGERIEPACGFDDESEG